MIFLKPDGIFIKDLDSTNGVLLKGVRISQGKLENKTEFQIGNTLLIFETDSKSSEIIPSDQNRYCRMVGRSKAIRKIFNLIETIAPTPATVLLQGQTGTGKELAARAIHTRSDRGARPFITVNCSAISPQIVESELFGHVKGAFSGADRERKGLFELAHKGVLFLDEISELPRKSQPKLLRVLEERVFRKVGGEKEMEVDVRIIAASNKHLSSLVKENKFRKDLYYRISMINVKMPTLLERKEDIPLLIKHFIKQESKALSLKKPPAIKQRDMDLLLGHHWPGNIRELANVIRRYLIVSCDKNSLDVKDIIFDEPPVSHSSMGTLEEIEKAAIKKALKRCSSKTEAAKTLGIALSTLYDKMKRHNIPKETK